MLRSRFGGRLFRGGINAGGPSFHSFLAYPWRPCPQMGREGAGIAVWNASSQASSSTGDGGRASACPRQHGGGAGIAVGGGGAVPVGDVWLSTHGAATRPDGERGLNESDVKLVELGFQGRVLLQHVLVAAAKVIILGSAIFETVGQGRVMFHGNHSAHKVLQPRNLSLAHQGPLAQDLGQPLIVSPRILDLRALI